MAEKNLIIFTDLDGTLLDLETYSYAGAEDALNRIGERNIPLVFCSSKTRAEQAFYQNELGINHPIIVENGGAIFIRNDYFDFEYAHQKSEAKYNIIEIGMPYKTIREKLAKIRDAHGFDFRGYGDMSVAEVSDLTGLDRQAAQRARERDYSETITFMDSPERLQKFKMLLQKQDLQGTHGGRFLTVTATRNDKGKAVKLLANLYRQSFDAILSVGIGDARNDLPLLSAVDVPILLQRPEENWGELSLPILRKVSGSGPKVWDRVIAELLDSASFFTSERR